MMRQFFYSLPDDFMESARIDGANEYVIFARIGLPQGIALFKGGYNTPYPEQLAVSVIACLPLVIVYIFLSKYFVQGITMTGLKG